VEEREKKQVGRARRGYKYPRGRVNVNTASTYWSDITKRMAMNAAIASW